MTDLENTETLYNKECIEYFEVDYEGGAFGNDRYMAEGGYEAEWEKQQMESARGPVCFAYSCALIVNITILVLWFINLKVYDQWAAVGFTHQHFFMFYSVVVPQVCLLL